MLFSLNVHDAILVWLFIMPYCPDSSQCPFSIPAGDSAYFPMSWFITRMMTWLYFQCCGLLPEWWHGFPHNVMVYFQADDMPSLPILRFISRLMICLPSPYYSLFPGWWYVFHPHVTVYFQADMPSIPMLWFISRLMICLPSPCCGLFPRLVTWISLGIWYPWLVTWIPLGVWSPILVIWIPLGIWYPWLVTWIPHWCLISLAGDIPGWWHGFPLVSDIPGWWDMYPESVYYHAYTKLDYAHLSSFKVKFDCLLIQTGCKMWLRLQQMEWHVMIKSDHEPNQPYWYNMHIHDNTITFYAV